MVRSGSGLCMQVYRSTLVPFHIGSMFACWWNLSLYQGAVNVALSMIHVSVSVANNFIHCQTAYDYGYHTFGEVARFIYCLLQKIKQGSSLPLVEQWDEFVLPNHPKFPPISDGDFLAGTRVLAALNKIGSSNLKWEFQRDARRFLEEFTTFVLPAVAARSKIGQGLSCFCPAIVIGGDDHAPLHFLGLLLDGLLERGWVKGSEIEACRSEYQSFIQVQRQLEWSPTRCRPDIGDVLSFCCSQAGFHARQHLFKVCIVTNVVKFHDRYLENTDFAFSGFPVDSSHCARTSDLWWAVHHQFGSADDL